MTPTKEQQAQEYTEKKLRTEYPDSVFTQMDKVVPLFNSYDIQQAYSDGYTACEQSMTDSEATVTQGWVARDNNGELYIYSEKPKRMQCLFWTQGNTFLPISPELFPSLTWSDEPIEVEITIKSINVDANTAHP